MFLSKYALDRNKTISSIFRLQYTGTPDFFVAEHYDLRNTTGTSRGSKDLVSGLNTLDAW
jgi:hypothetical protein